jgi:hypothetical protein
LDLREEAVDQATLINKLLKIEALFSGATTPGEQAAAAHARDRIMERLRVLTVEDPAVEYTFTMPDMWSRKVSLALIHRYELKPYRRHRQRYTTVMVSVPERFVNEALWPEYQRLDDELRRYLSEVTDRIVTQVLQADSSQAPVVQQRQLL